MIGSWRGTEQESSLKRYCEEEKKESDTSKMYNQIFIRKRLTTAAEVGTVASKIKANMNNIQRSGRAMDTNYFKMMISNHVIRFVSYIKNYI